MSYWPSCDLFVGYDPQNFYIGPQDCKLKWEIWVTFGKPAMNKTV